MASFKDWMMLLRPHGAALLIPMSLIGYTLTHDSFFTLESLFWALFAVAWGIIGNIHNSVVDHPIDVKDLYKKHFPLVGKRISVEKATRISTISLFTLGIVGIIGTGFDPAYSLLVVFGIAAGLSYNWSSKTFGASALMAGLAFPVPLLLAAQEVNHLVILVYIFFVIQFTLQNGIGGGFKDLVSDQSNMVKKLGVKLFNDKIMRTGKVIIFSLTLRIMMVLSMFGVLTILEVNPLLILVMLPPILILFILTAKQCKPQIYNKKQQTKITVLIEMSSYYLLVSAIAISVLPTELIFLLVFPPIIFIILNKLSWGTAITPKT